MPDMVSRNRGDERCIYNTLVLKQEVQKLFCNLGYDMISSLGLPTSSDVKVITLDGKPPIYRIMGKSRVRGQIR